MMSSLYVCIGFNLTLLSFNQVVKVQTLVKYLDGHIDCPNQTSSMTKTPTCVQCFFTAYWLEDTLGFLHLRLAYIWLSLLYWMFVVVAEADNGYAAKSYTPPADTGSQKSLDLDSSGSSKPHSTPMTLKW